MPRNASGTYTLPTGNPVVSGDIISSTWANDTMGDVASALTASLARDGSGGMTAALRVVDGSVSVPGLAFGNETGSGLYRSAAGDVGLAILGNQILRMRSTGLDVTGAVGVSGNLAFSSTGNRITGDFTNATESSRVMFQTSTATSATVLGVIPNGAVTSTGIYFYNDPSTNNCARFDVGLLSSGSEARLSSTRTGTGTYVPMTFYTGGSERVRIDTSGRVGIGTSSPLGRIDALSNTGTNASWYRFASDTRSNPPWTGAAASGLMIGGNRVSGTDNVHLAWGTGQVSTASLTFDTWNGTTYTERMRIDSSGNLLVGVTTDTGSPNNGVTIRNSTGGTLGNIGIGHASGVGSGNAYMAFAYNSSQIGSITQNGTTAVSYNTSSDYRLKESISPMTGALAKNELLNPVTYKWKSDGSDGQGFIAHELQAVFPDAVTGEKDAVDADGNPQYQGVDTSFLVGHLVACIKELNAKVSALEAAV